MHHGHFALLMGGSSSAVERQLPNSPSFKTINDLTRLPGTAKYLITRGSENLNGCRNGGLCGTAGSVQLKFGLWGEYEEFRD